MFARFMKRTREAIPAGRVMPRLSASRSHRPAESSPSAQGGTPSPSGNFRPGATRGRGLPVAVLLLALVALVALPDQAAAQGQAPVTVAADWSLIPSGLGAGDSFRLIFISSTKRNGSSTDVATYNTFIAGRAAAGHTAIQSYADQFKVVGCTAGTDARDNTATTYTSTDKGVPIYWLSGSKVADDYEDFYDESWDNEGNSDDRNESGDNTVNTATSSNYPLTGCDHDGTESFILGGSFALGAPFTQQGRPGTSNTNTATNGPLSSENFTNQNNSRPMYGLSPVFTVAVSNDATLSGLALEDASDDSALTLDPVFATGTTSYAVAVGNGVDTVTVKPTVNESHATVAYFDGADVVIADADSNKDDQQVELVVGENTIKVTVTAQDTTTIETYTVTVTRASSTAALVDNWGVGAASFELSLSANDRGQRFRTGDNPTGYVLTSIDINMQTGVSSGELTVSLWSANSSNLPDTVLATFVNPGNLSSSGKKTFTAPADTHLDVTTRYIITFEYTSGASPQIRSRDTTSVSSSSASGWRLGRDVLKSSGGTWQAAIQDRAIRIRIFGNPSDPASNDATLSGLELEDGDGNGITLDPVFAPGTTSYTAAVVNRIDKVTLTATKNDDDATVAITDDDDAATPGEAELSLVEGENIIEVVVTAEDGTTTSTYTITATRATLPPAPSDCPSDTDWCATLRVGYTVGDAFFSLATYGYDYATNLGDLSSNTFSYNGLSYAVTELHRKEIRGGDIVLSDLLSLWLDGDLPDGTVLQVGSQTFTVGADSDKSDVGLEQWDLLDDPPPAWTGGENVTVSLKIPPPTDVTLSALALEDGDGTAITLDPVFAPGTTSYTASPAYDVAAVTITATPADDTASVAFSPADSDTVADGHQVALGEEGETTTLTAVVTAADTTTGTYMVAVTRQPVGICERTPAVQTAILGKISGISACADVTTAHLAAIGGTLDLAYESIAALAEGDFAGLTSLETLLLNNNALTSLAANTFAGLTSLETLNLNNNALTSLDANAFAGLAALTELDLSSNALTSLDANTFAGLTALTDLYLSYNYLTSLPAGVFDGPTLLSVLALNNNDLTSLAANTFAGLTALTTLNLNTNDLTSLPANAFEGLTALKALDVRDNDLTSLDANAFIGLTALTNLDLRQNELSELPAGVFAEPTGLTYLGLSFNELSALPAGVFDQLTKLELLNLRDNQLSDLPVGVFEKLTELTELTLVNNPGSDDFVPTAMAAATPATLPTSGGEVALDAAGSGGAWGANVSYGWALTGPTGVTVTYAPDAASAMTTATVPGSLTDGSTLTFTLTVTGRGGATYIDTDTADVDVGDAPTVSIADASAAEGENITFTATLSAAQASAVTVDYTTSIETGDTAAADDFTAASATTLTIPANQTSATFTVATTEDTDVETDETFTVTLSNPSTGIALGSMSAATGTILDDDATNATGEPTITGTPQVGETLTAGQGDIDDEDGLPSGTFPAGYTFQWVRVDADGMSNPANIGTDSDTYMPVAADVGKRIRVKVSFTDGGGVVERRESDATAAVEAAGVTVKFVSAAGGYTATEGGAGTDVLLVLSEALGHEVVIPITVTHQDGATAEDYSGVPSSVTFPAGVTFRGFTVTAVDDFDDDDGESLLFGLGTPLPAGVTTGSLATVTLELLDNDSAVRVFFGASSYTAMEGGTAATVTVQLTLAAGSEIEIPITSTPQGGAVTGDYSGVPASVTFGSSDTAKTFTVTAVDDSTFEIGEGVQLGLGTLPAGVTADRQSTTMVNLHDNDGAEVSVSYGASTYTATEGGTSATVTVQLNGTAGREVVIPITSTPQNGAGTGDYSGVPASVTFSATETSKTFTVTATDDTTDDDNENVQLGFGPLPLGVTTGSQGTTTVSLDDNDDPAVTVWFLVSQLSTREGGAGVTVEVALSAEPEREVVIPITATPQGGAVAGDYSGVPASVTFGASDTEKTFTVTAVDDSDDDDGESVQLGFGTLPAGVSVGNTPTATVNLDDDDNATNNAPVFANASETRSFNETIGDAAVSTASDIGAVFTATDADGDTLTYTLEGADSSKFTIVSASGQIKTKVGETYSYEDETSYEVTVKADDGNGGTDTVDVTINVLDVFEAPAAPAAPSVSATPGSTTSLDVSWSAPGNTGRPAITNYDLRYRQGNSGSWTNGPQDQTGTSASIGSLTAGTSYQVQVRATNDEGNGGWSGSGSGSTDDDLPILSVSPATAIEGEALEFAVTLSSASADAVTVAYAATGVTATAGTDFTAPGSGATLTIPAGDTTATITIETLADTVDEDAETLTLTLSAPQNATLGTATATGTIDEMVVDVSRVIYMRIEPDPNSNRALTVKWRSVYLISPEGVVIERIPDYDIQYAEELSGWPYRVDGEDWLTVTYPRWINGMTWQGWSGTIESLAESESERGSVHYRARLAGLTEGQAYRRGAGPVVVRASGGAGRGVAGDGFGAAHGRVGGPAREP